MGHYAIGEQEFATGAITKASHNGQHRFILVLYEDAIAHPVTQQQTLLNFLNAHVPQLIESREQKTHSADLCQYSDIDCETLRRHLRGQYPCLLRQFNSKNATIAWTMPILPNGTISLRGGCKPLRSLPNATGYARRLWEIYESAYKLRA